MRSSTLLSFIRGAETRLGYDDYSDQAKTVLPTPKRPSEMTVAEVQAWQRSAARAGAASVAFGGYQLITSTFNGVVEELGLSPDTVMSADVQDRMGEHLLKRRGYDRWTAGEIDDDTFIGGLAQEWAGLPALSGRSHYDGDGLNGATRDLGQLRNALELTRSGQMVDLSNLPRGAAPAPVQVPTALPSEEEAEALEVFATPVPTFDNLHDPVREKRARAAAGDTGPGFGDAARAAFTDEWALSWFSQQAGAPEFAPDANYRMTEESFKQLADGLPNEYAEEWLSQAHSEAHALFLRQKAQEDFERDRTLSEYGLVPGLALRFGAAMTDPIGIGAGILTGGFGTAAVRAGRVRRFILGGASAGAANAMVDGYIASQDPMMGIEDVAFSAMAGFVVGGALGALPRTQLNTELEGVFRETLEEVRTGVSRQPLPEGSSVGAAQVPTEEPLNGARWAAKVSAGAPRTALAEVRFDVSAQLKRSDNAMVRDLGGELVEDAVGNADGSATRFSASERITLENRRRVSRFYRTAEPAFNAWAKANGKSRWKLADREEFFDTVGRAVRRPLDMGGDPHVNAVVSRVKAEMADMLQYAKDSGLRGFENVKENAEYLTRQHNLKRIDELTERYGGGQLNQLVAGAMDSYRAKLVNNGKAAPSLLEEDTLKLAAAYLRSIRNRRHGDFDMARALGGSQEDVLRDMLDDAGTDPEAVDRIMAALRDTPRSENDGKIASGRRRLGLDESFEMKAFPRNSGGGRSADEADTLRIEDLLENNVEHLYQGYVRSVTSAAELGKAFEKYRVPGPDGTLGETPSWATVRSYLQENGASKPEVETLEAVVNVLQGRPSEPPKRWHEAARIARDYNFVRLMGQVGFAQIAEIGNIIGHAGWRASVQQMPILRKLYANAKTGEFSNDLLKELEYHLAFGTDFVRHSPTVRVDDFGMREDLGLNSARARQADYTLQQAKRATSVVSGMTHINMGLQRFATAAMAQKFVNFGKSGKGIGVRRLRSLGLSEGDVTAIAEELRTKPVAIDGPFGRRVKSLNLEAWDPTSKAVFLQALDRYSRRVVQENDIGNLPLFMTKEAGKLIFQFRSFMLGAWVKQTLAGIHMRDRAAAMSLLGSSVFGGLSYIAQTHLQAIGRGDREDWVERKLAPVEIGKAAFQRTGYSSLVPTFADTIISPMVQDDAFFSARTTGMGAAVWDNPTRSLVEGGLQTAQSAARAAWDPDREFTREDFRMATGLLAFQRVLGVSNVLNMVGEAGFQSRYDLAQR